MYSTFDHLFSRPAAPLSPISYLLSPISYLLSSLFYLSSVMHVALLSSHPAAVAEALRGQGWEGQLANETAAGIASAAFLISGLDADVIEAMLPVAARLGIQLLSGGDWMVLVGPHSRLGAFARPWVQPE